MLAEEEKVLVCKDHISTFEHNFCLTSNKTSKHENVACMLTLRLLNNKSMKVQNHNHYVAFEFLNIRIMIMLIFIELMNQHFTVSMNDNKIV